MKRKKEKQQKHKKKIILKTNKQKTKTGKHSFESFDLERIWWSLFRNASCALNKTRQDKTRQDKTRRDETRRDKTRFYLYKLRHTGVQEDITNSHSI